jgi:hypothetical protein
VITATVATGRYKLIFAPREVSSDVPPKEIHDRYVVTMGRGRISIATPLNGLSIASLEVQLAKRHDQSVTGTHEPIAMLLMSTSISYNTCLARTEIRSLAYPEESHVDLCKRLFGDTICPDLPSLWSEACPDEFLYALRHSYRRSWKFISIGHHSFLSNAFDYAESDQKPSLQEWRTHISVKRIIDISAVETLRISVVRAGYGDSNYTKHGEWVGRFAIDTMSRLREVDLFLTPAYRQGMHIWTDRATYDWVGIQGPEAPHFVFWHIFVARRHGVEVLAIVTLRKMTFEQAAKHKFLTGLKKLHTLHLIDCMSLETYDEFLSLAEAILSPSLRLAGVGIYGLRFLEPGYQAGSRPGFDQELRERTRIKRRLDYDLAVQCDLVPEFHPYTAQDWPCERPELEAAILGGRKNNVVRKAHAAPDQEVQEDWAKISVQRLASALAHDSTGV